MTTTAELQKVDTENVAQVLKGVCAELTQSADPVVLDFADVRRIDPAGLRAFEDLAAAADQKAVKIVLQA